jgi:hypothetical protein
MYCWLLALSAARSVSASQADPPAIRGDSEQALQRESGYSPPAWPDAPDAAAMFSRLVLGTAIVLGVCITTLCCGRRWFRRPLQDNGTGRLRLVESIALGNRCFVYLLQTEHHHILAGTDTTGLKALIALPELFDAALANAAIREVASERSHEGNGVSKERAISHV